MSGIRFCSECLNILHPEEEKNEHRLLFVCKSCDYREYIQDLSSMEENKIYQRDFMQSVTESFIDPDYCLDPTMPRERVICPNCRYYECAYLIDREPGDKMLKKVYVCGRLNKSGRPDCKNIFSAHKYIKIGTKGETYAYREYGTHNDNVLIMLHGNFTSSYIFERTFFKLSEKFNVIAPDLRGFGLSSYSTKLTSFNDLADDLNYFLNELKITKFALLGWDLGAAVALKYAALHPTYLDKLILVNPIGLSGKTFIKDPYEDTPLPEWPSNKEEIEKDNRVAQFVAALKDRKGSFFKTYFQEEIFTVRVPEDERLESYIQQFVMQKNLHDILACLADYDIAVDDIYKVQTETLILAGQLDVKTPVADAVEIKKALGEISTIKIFEEAGHVLMEDNLDDFCENVIDFCLTSAELE